MKSWKIRSLLSAASAFAALPSTSFAETAPNPCDDMAAGRPVQTVSAEAFALGMRGAAPGPKGVYETTAQYEARSRQKLQDFLEKNPYVVFRKEIIGNFAFEYDADNQNLIYKQSGGLRCIGNDARMCVNIHLERSDSTSTLRSYDVSFSPPSDNYTPYPTIKASPERARSIREGEIMLNGTVELVMVVVPEAPYVVTDLRSMSGGRSGFYEENILPVRLLCTGWLIKTKR